MAGVAVIKLIDVFARGRFFDGQGEHTAANRRMAPELAAAEKRLTSWGDHTRIQAESGYPRRSVTERASEGGILAGDPRPPTFLSDADAEVDKIIARFPLPWQKTARCNWQYLHEPREARAARAGLSLDSLKRRCEVIRWAVKIAIEEGPFE